MSDRYRERILDAARDCYIAAPMSDRMHALIAEKAGLSRPTVYKYVGDQDAIRQALLERGAASFVQALMPVFAQRMPLREHFRELVIAGVLEIRSNELFMAWLDHSPETVARALTLDLAPVVEHGTDAAAAQVRAVLPEGADQRVPLVLMFEWGVRLCMSIVTTPSPFHALESAGEIRAYLDTLFTIIDVPDSSS